METIKIISLNEVYDYMINQKLPNLQQAMLSLKESGYLLKSKKGRIIQPSVAGNMYDDIKDADPRWTQNILHQKKNSQKGDAFKQWITSEIKNLWQSEFKRDLMNEIGKYKISPHMIKSRFVECPECRKIVKSSGLKNHHRMAHDPNSFWGKMNEGERKLWIENMVAKQRRGEKYG